MPLNDEAVVEGLQDADALDRIGLVLEVRRSDVLNLLLVALDLLSLGLLGHPVLDHVFDVLLGRLVRLILVFILRVRVLERIAFLRFHFDIAITGGFVGSLGCWIFALLNGCLWLHLYCCPSLIMLNSLTAAFLRSSSSFGIARTLAFLSFLAFFAFLTLARVLAGALRLLIVLVSSIWVLSLKLAKLRGCGSLRELTSFEFSLFRSDYRTNECHVGVVILWHVVQRVEDLAPELLHVRSVRRWLLLFGDEHDHFVSDRLGVVVRQRVLRLFLQLRELFLFFPLLCLLLVLKVVPRVDQGLARFGTHRVAGEPEVRGDFVEDGAAAAWDVRRELDDPFEVFDLLEDLHDHVVADISEEFLVVDGHVGELLEYVLRNEDVPGPRELLLQQLLISLDGLRTRRDAPCHVLGHHHLLDARVVTGQDDPTFWLVFSWRAPIFFCLFHICTCIGSCPSCRRCAGTHL